MPLPPRRVELTRLMERVSSAATNASESGPKFGSGCAPRFQAALEWLQPRKVQVGLHREVGRDRGADDVQQVGIDRAQGNRRDVFPTARRIPALRAAQIGCGYHALAARVVLGNVGIEMTC